MKPIEPGCYWMRPNYKSASTGEIIKSDWEVVVVFMGGVRRAFGLAFRGLHGPPELVSNSPDLWDWSEKIKPPE